MMTLPRLKLLAILAPLFFLAALELVLDGTLDLMTRDPIPTGAENLFNKSFRINAGEP